MSTSATEQPGVIPIWILNGRRSSSGDRARLDEIKRDLQLTPVERILKALSLGAASTNVRDDYDSQRNPAARK